MTVPFFALAMGLGSKHAYDADHLVAVGNLLTGSRSLLQTATLVPFWVVGHMSTALAITLALWFSRETYLKEFLGQLEVAVVLMLFGLGAWRILAFAQRKWGHVHEHGHRVGEWLQRHSHGHFHLQRYRSHFGLFGIGVVHGISSNDEVLVLATTALAVTSLGGLLLGVALFSLGVLLGMLLFGLGLTYPLVLRGGERARELAKLVAGVACVAYGVWLLAGMGRLNPVPFAG